MTSVRLSNQSYYLKINKEMNIELDLGINIDTYEDKVSFEEVEK